MGIMITFFSASQAIIPRNNPDSSGNKISADAIWRPSFEAMQKIYTVCGALQENKMYDCLLNEMSAAGAPEAATRFSAMINGKGYMDGYKQLGEVGVASVYYVFRNTNHEGCLLVNCTPDLINVDDHDYLNIDRLEQNQAYRELKNSYRYISIYPVDRKGTDYPEKKDLPHHGVRIIVNYSLRNGCDNCPLLGFAYFASDFDSTGNFLGAKFIRIKKSIDLQSETASAGNLQNVFSDPSEPVNVVRGEKFVIVLESNHSAGLKWVLGKPLDNKVLTLLGTNFVQPFETLPNAAGKETWTFQAVGSGTTNVKFNYVYSWEAGAKPLESYSFKVNVK